MDSRHLGYTKVLPADCSVEEALQRVTAALKEHGFGVITTIDVQKTVKEKLGHDMAPYHILGACNPPIAHQAISADPFVGLLMPCNVLVFQQPEGVTVSFVKADEMFRLVNRPEMAAFVQQVDSRIKAAFELV